MWKKTTKIACKHTKLELNNYWKDATKNYKCLTSEIGVPIGLKTTKKKNFVIKTSRRCLEKLKLLELIKLIMVLWWRE